jgi:lysophospholipase L1-like esterase
MMSEKNATVKSEDPPRNFDNRDPTTCSQMTGTSRSIVACLGASITAAKGSYNWIEDLSRRPTNSRLRFCNFGVGGDLAYNALKRLPSVISCNPHKVVILVGHNDVIAMVSRKVRRIFSVWKHLPRAPSPDFYAENLRAIVRQLKDETAATVALCSLSPIGEDPTSADSFQQKLNCRILEFNEIIRDVARDENLDYVPVYELFQRQTLSLPLRSFTAFKFTWFYRDALRQFVMHQDLDEISELNGWQVHTDGIHLNSRGGKILADAVQGWLDRKLE